MKVLNPYINFSGRCREALEFYKSVFDGEITFLQTFRDSNQNIPGEDPDKIMHAEFKANGINFMASDGFPGIPAPIGKAISMNITLDDELEQMRIFNALAEGGNVSMPLQEMFWGARFGDLTDKFGIKWMLNCHHP